jgi:hypothetical protein
VKDRVPEKFTAPISLAGYIFQDTKRIRTLDNTVSRTQNGMQTLALRLVYPMEHIRIFFDHLVFSLVSVSAVLLVVSLIIGGFVPEYSLGDYFWFAAALWAIVSISVAAALTYSSIKNKAPDRVDFTHRRY